MSKRLSQVSLSLVVGTNRRDVSDVELAHGLAAGEAWAMGVTWHRFAPMVLTMAERSLGSRSDAEDLAQDVFLSISVGPTLCENPKSCEASSTLSRFSA